MVIGFTSGYMNNGIQLLTPSVGALEHGLRVAAPGRRHLMASCCPRSATGTATWR